MPIKYKIEIMKALKDAGYSTYRLRKEKILGEATLQKFLGKYCYDLQAAELSAR